MDMSFVCEGERVQAHKLVLETCSPLLRAVFAATPCEHPILVLQGTKLPHLRAVLQFMYTGETVLDENMLPGFLQTAEELGVCGLANPPTNFAEVSEASLSCRLPPPAATRLPSGPSVDQGSAADLCKTFKDFEITKTTAAAEKNFSAELMAPWAKTVHQPVLAEHPIDTLQHNDCDLCIKDSINLKPVSVFDIIRDDPKPCSVLLNRSDITNILIKSKYLKEKLEYKKSDKTAYCEHKLSKLTLLKQMQRMCNYYRNTGSFNYQYVNKLMFNHCLSKKVKGGGLGNSDFDSDDDAFQCPASNSNISVSPPPKKSGDKIFQCLKCDKKFRCNKSLVQHNKNIDCLQMKATIRYPRQCKKCIQSFLTSTLYHSHIRTCYKTECKDTKTPIIYPRKCIKCIQYFSNKRKYYNHIRFCGTVAVRQKTECIADGCDLKFYKRTDMIAHLESIHFAKFQKMNFHFLNEDDFNKWKESIELNSHSYFSAKNGTRICDEVSYSYYTCQFDAARTSHCKAGKPYRRTDIKHKKGVIPHLNCPARMLVIKCNQSDEIAVTYIATHNHEIDFQNCKFQPVAKSTKNIITNQLILGVPPKSVLKNLSTNNEKWNRTERSVDMELDKEDCLNVRYISRLKYKLKSENFLHSDDATAVMIKLETLAREKFNPVLIYKPLGGDVVFGSPKFNNVSNAKDLFLCALQTEAQRDVMLENINKIACIDATHGLTPYDMKLVTLVVPTPFNTGYPVMHVITNRETVEIMSLVFETLQINVPTLKFSTVMSDDDDISYQSIVNAFGPNVRHLLCKWHIYNTWKRNLRSRIKDEILSKEVYECLVAMLEEVDKDNFELLLSGFLEKYKLKCKAFVQYFKKKYVSRKEKWAMCYRNFPHAKTNTNMYCESFHNKLKTYYLERKAQNRLEMLIDVLLEIDYDNFRNYLLKRKLNDPSNEILTRHRNGMNIKDEQITLVSKDMWSIKSQSVNNTMYFIERIEESCAQVHCYERCTERSCLGLCYHMYQCDCPDTNGMCKHIHKLHSFLKRNCNEENEGDLNNLDDYSSAPMQLCSKPFVEMERTESESEIERKKKECVNFLSELGTLLSNNSVSDLLLPNIHKNLRELINQCNCISNSKDIPSEMKKTKKPMPNEKFKCQPRSFPHKKRNSLSTKTMRKPNFLHQQKLKNGLLKFATQNNVPQYSESNVFSLPDFYDDDMHCANISDNINDCISPPNESYNVTLPMSIANDDLNCVASEINIESNASSNHVNCIVNSTRNESSNPLSFTPLITPEMNINNPLKMVRGSFLTVLDLKSLDPYCTESEKILLQNAWHHFEIGQLTDTVIDAYIHTISAQNNCIANFTVSEMELLLRGQDMSFCASTFVNTNLKYVVFPVNVQNYHWTVFIYDVHQNKIEFLDSLLPQKKTVIPKGYSYLEKFIVKIFNVEGIGDLKYPVTAKQHDSVSCGVYVCHFVKMISLQNPYTTPLNVNMFRKEIYDSIFP